MAWRDGNALRMGVRSLVRCGDGTHWLASTRRDPDLRTGREPLADRLLGRDGRRECCRRVRGAMGAEGGAEDQTYGAGVALVGKPDLKSFVRQRHRWRS